LQEAKGLTDRLAELDSHIYRFRSWDLHCMNVSCCILFLKPCSRACEVFFLAYSYEFRADCLLPVVLLGDLTGCIRAYGIRFVPWLFTRLASAVSMPGIPCFCVVCSVVVQNHTAHKSKRLGQEWCPHFGDPEGLAGMATGQATRDLGSL